MAGAGAGAGAAAVDGPTALERDGGVPRHVNGFVTPTAENPEYLGLVDTWSGHTWGVGQGIMWWTQEESQIGFYWEKWEKGNRNICVTERSLVCVFDMGNSMCMWNSSLSIEWNTWIQSSWGCHQLTITIIYDIPQHSVALIWCLWHDFYFCLPFTAICDCSKSKFIQPLYSVLGAHRGSRRVWL